MVTNQCGRTCHAAIIARELDIPAIVGMVTGTTVIRTGEAVAVCCAEGEEGHIYEGILPFETKEVGIEDLPRTRTEILMNIGNTQDAFNLAAIPNDGVGLARIDADGSRGF